MIKQITFQTLFEFLCKSILVICLLLVIIIGIYDIVVAIMWLFPKKEVKQKEFDTRPKIDQLNEVFNERG